MATVIDSLIVTLGLDPSNFDKGRKQAAANLLETKGEAVKAAKEIEEHSNRAAEAILKVSREVLGLFAVFIGGRGLKDFLSDITKTNLALDSMSYSLKTTPQFMAAVGMLVERLGGSGARAQESLHKLSDTLAELLPGGGGQVTAQFNDLARLFGAAKMNFDWQKGANEKFFYDLAAAARKVSAEDKTGGHVLVTKALGGDEKLAELIETSKNDASLHKAMREAMGLAPSDTELKAAVEVREAWVKVRQEIDFVGTGISTKLSEPMTGVLKQFDKWLDDNKEWIKEKVDEGFVNLGKAIKTLKEDIEKAWPYVEPILIKIDDYVKKNLGGWHTVIETLALAKLAGWALTASGAFSVLSLSIIALSLAFLGLKASVEWIASARPNVEKFFGDILHRGHGGAKIGAEVGAGYVGPKQGQGGAIIGAEVGDAYRPPPFGGSISDEEAAKARGYNPHDDPDTPRGHEMGGAWPSALEQSKTVEEPIYKGILRALKDFYSTADSTLGGSGSETGGTGGGGGGRGGGSSGTGGGTAATGGDVGGSGGSSTGTVGGGKGMDAMAATGAAPIRSGISTVTSPSGRTYRVASEFAPNFQGFLNDYEKAGGLVGPNTGGGGISTRGNPSYHPLGRAIDINQVARNRRAGGVTLPTAQENELAARWGIYPGSLFHGSPDAGHFEVRDAAKARAIMKQRSRDSLKPQSSLQLGMGAKGIAAINSDNRRISNNQSSTEVNIGAVAVQTKGVEASNQNAFSTVPQLDMGTGVAQANYGVA